VADFSNEAQSVDEPHVRLAPAGDWTELAPFERPRAPRDEHVDNGRCFWLSDTQIDLTGPERVWLTRTVSEVTGPDGLHDAAQIDLDFDPTYERIVFHHVRVIRDGLTREVDPIAGLSVFRRERDLERARYDGRLTAHIVVPDVRVGDIVDLAHSSIGAPPIFGDRFSAEWSFSWGCWVGETRVRVLTAADSELVVQSWNDAPETLTRQLPDGRREWQWRASDTAAVAGEPDAACWARRVMRVKACSPLSWRDVADAFRGQYAPEPLPEDLETEVAALEAEVADPAQRAVRLLRLTQSALRYQAVSIGDGGFVPRPVARIWALRAGDCKDASRLLATLMQRIGLDAVPALVDTARGWTLRDEAPSLNLFNHCIVRLRLDGRDYWLDPTNYRQGGGLDVLHQARYGWALPLIADADLVHMGDEPVREVFAVDETYTLGSTPVEPATLTVTTSFGAWRADAVRRSLESDRAGLVRGYIEHYSRYYGEVTELQPLEVHDDLEANELRLTERYRLGRAWEKHPDSDDVEFGPVDDLFGQHFTTARSARRRLPIDLGLPRQASWSTTIRLPVAVDVNGWDRRFAMPGIQAVSRHEQADPEGREVKLVRSARFERQFLPADEADAYFDLRDQALRSAGLTVTIGVTNGTFNASAPAPPASKRAAKPQRFAWLKSANFWRLAWLAFWALVILGRSLAAHMPRS